MNDNATAQPNMYERYDNLKKLEAVLKNAAHRLAHHSYNGTEAGWFDWFLHCLNDEVERNDDLVDLLKTMRERIDVMLSEFDD